LTGGVGREPGGTRPRNAATCGGRQGIRGHITPRRLFEKRVDTNVRAPCKKGGAPNFGGARSQKREALVITVINSYQFMLSSLGRFHIDTPRGQSGRVGQSFAETSVRFCLPSEQPSQLPLRRAEGLASWVGRIWAEGVAHLGPGPVPGAAEVVGDGVVHGVDERCLEPLGVRGRPRGRRGALRHPDGPARAVRGGQQRREARGVPHC